MRVLSEFGVPLPLRVIVSQLGAPEEDLPLFRKWTDAFIGNLSQQLDRDGLLNAAKDMVEFQHYFVDRMNERRENPKDDILSMVVNASIDGEKPLEDAECLSMISQILVAGNETTSATLTEGMWLLIQNPDQYEKLLQNPGLIPKMVPEIIRWQSPVAHMARTATQDTELGGKQIKQGDKVVMWYLSGNHDESAIDSPNAFIIDRDNPRYHLSFGFGIHRCMGNRLGEMQLRILWEEILQRFSDVQMIGKPQRVQSNFVRGYSDLQVVLHS